MSHMGGAMQSELISPSREEALLMWEAPCLLVNIITLLIIVCFALCSKEAIYRRFSVEIICIMLLYDFCRSLGTIMGRHSFTSLQCTIEGAMVTFGNIGCFTYILLLGFFTNLQIRSLAQSHDVAQTTANFAINYRLPFHFCAFLFAVVCAGLPAMNSLYVDTGDHCWIEKSVTGLLARGVSYYIWLVLTFVMSIVLSCMANYQTSVIGYESGSLDLDMCRWYPTWFYIIYLWSVVRHTYELLYPNRLPFILTLLEAIALSLYGFVGAIYLLLAIHRSNDIAKDDISYMYSSAVGAQRTVDTFLDSTKVSWSSTANPTAVAGAVPNDDGSEAEEDPLPPPSVSASGVSGVGAGERVNETDSMAEDIVPAAATLSSSALP